MHCDSPALGDIADGGILGRGLYDRFIMRKTAAILLLLLVCASPAAAEKFLSVSDIHFDPFADPALVTKLEAADVAQWDAILSSSTSHSFSADGSDVNDPLLRSAVAE